MTTRSAEGLLADGAAAVTTSTAGITWMAQINDVLQLIVTAIAIVTGIYAIRYHRIRIAQAKRKQTKEQQNVSTD